MIIEMRTSQNEERPIGELFKDFIKYCKVKNLAEKTIYSYKEHFRIFNNFYPASRSARNIDEMLIQDYILFLRETTKLNNISINSRIRGLRAILYYFMKMGHMKEFKISLIKAEKKIKETYSDKELEALLKKPDVKTCTFGEYRDWAIVCYLIATGNRVNTLINIKIKDLDFDSNMITLIETKNKRQQLIPMANTLSRILQEYLNYRKGETDDYLFCDINGNKLSDNALRKTIRKYNRNRGVTKASLHLFRHTFAKNWVTENGDIFRLQKILGHSSLDMVKEYVNMFSNDLQKDFDKYNLLDRLSNNKDRIKMK